jgi:hypothetical protein
LGLIIKRKMKNYSGFKTLKTVHRKEISYSYFGCSFSDGQQISKAHLDSSGLCGYSYKTNLALIATHALPATFIGSG